ncbi:MAG TPA: AMP-binding protein [Acidimicrobiales bacterium]|nr:AMP-binding protein [Acidimicrobiales bacterium]
MGLSYDEAVAQVTGPGQVFEVVPAVVRGVEQRVFAHAPATLRELFAAARGYGSKPFLVFEDERLSFAEVMAGVDALGAALVHRYGVRPGDRVAIAMRNRPEWVVAFAAVTSIGAVSVSLNAWWTAGELDYGLGDSEATVLIADRDRALVTVDACARRAIRCLVARAGPDTLPPGLDRWEDVCRPGPPLPDVAVDPDDDATILYTSGTTGRPKGAVSTHRNVVQALMGFACKSAVESAREPAPPEQGEPAAERTFILVVPLFHATGCIPVMLSCFALGMRLVMLRRWDPERALELIERERVTTFVGVPTQAWDLLASPAFARYDTSSLRSVSAGGAPAPPALVRRVAAAVPAGGPGIGYGLTETNAYGTGNSGIDYLTHPSSAGRATPILQVAVRDAAGADLPVGSSGEIWLKGPNVFRGYWHQPEATAAVLVDGWLRTGDVGRLDADGFLYVEDRLKDVILRGGENVYPAEVEAALYEHPAVQEAAVIGVPDARLGEEVAAVVVARPGAEIDAADLTAFIAGRLAAFKVPTRLVLRGTGLPRNAAGKVLKRELRATIGGEGGSGLRSAGPTDRAAQAPPSGRSGGRS